MKYKISQLDRFTVECIREDGKTTTLPVEGTSDAVVIGGLPEWYWGRPDSRRLTDAEIKELRACLKDHYGAGASGRKVIFEGDQESDEPQGPVFDVSKLDDEVVECRSEGKKALIRVNRNADGRRVVINIDRYNFYDPPHHEVELDEDAYANLMTAVLSVLDDGTTDFEFHSEYRRPPAANLKETHHFPPSGKKASSAGANRMQDAWSLLERFIKVKAPNLAATLLPGATTEQLTDAEAALEVTLPSDFKDFYRVHDGQAANAEMGLFYGLTMLSLEQIIENVGGDSSEEDEYADQNTSSPDGHIRKIFSSSKWIPFCHDYSGNYLGIDLDPDAEGSSGQVINFGRDESDKFVVAESFREFMKWISAQLEDGNFVVEGNSFNLKRPPSKHFTEGLRELFSTV